jgi:uncharacterized protein YcbK (DUF882 family)
MTGNETRRRFLACMGGAAVAGLAGPASASILQRSPRKLAFDNLHTGERASIEYWAQGRYEPDALQEINVILRDFRSGEVHPIDPGLLDLLHDLQVNLASSKPFEVISGFRSPHTNQMLRDEGHGTARKSQHMLGKAIDIRLPDRALADLHRAAVSLKRGGVGFYPASDFVHVDTGRVRYW